MERTKKKIVSEEEPEVEEILETKQEETDEIPKDLVEQDVPEVEEEQKEEVEEKLAEVDPDPEIEWKKIGGGSLRLATKLIPPGATFKARASDIPKAFRDVVIPLQDLPEPIRAAAVPIVKTIYQIVPRGRSRALYDIIGPNGKRMNEHPLSKAVAERLKADLEK